MTTWDPFDDPSDLDGDGIGCCNCGYDGWVHGCCDDICHSINEAEWCDRAIPCRHCNPDGDLR